MGEDENAWKDDDFLSFGEEDTTTVAAVAAAEGGDVAAPLPASTGASSNGSDRGTGSALASTSASAFASSAASASASAPKVPPWMDGRSPSSSSWQHNQRRSRHQHPPPAPLVSLHNEIVDFATLMEPRDYEIREREELVRRVTELVEDTFGGDGGGGGGDGGGGGGGGREEQRRRRCQVKVFGSQATGLFLPASDIDLVLVMPDADAESDGNGNDDDKESQRERDDREMREWDIPSAQQSSKSPLVTLGEALRERWEDELSYLEVIESTRIPIVKFTHAPSNLSVDICLNQETGTKAAELVKRFGNAMPPLRPLTFVLKYFMAARGLNEPYSGGVGSFLLQMMIVSFLQHREREEYQASGQESILNLGSLLLEFFELYGIDFNYVTTGISIRNDGSYFSKGAKNRREHFWQPTRPFSLALENPFELEMDVGKASFRMQLVQRSFEVAYRVLLSHVSEPAVPAVSILASILPPTDEMTERAATSHKMGEGGNAVAAAAPHGLSRGNSSDMDMSS